MSRVPARASRGDSGPERRVITTGDYTTEFVVIESGIQEGENIYLLAPDEGWDEAVDAA